MPFLILGGLGLIALFASSSKKTVSSSGSFPTQGQVNLASPDNPNAPLVEVDLHSLPQNTNTSGIR